MSKKKRIELLAPAGGEAQLIAAVENGADAVYLGGRLFNARMNAGNFDDKAMQQAIDYAHLHGVQIHVTLNTLVKDEELPRALEYAAFLYEAGVDALIIQDLGLAHLIRQFMPDLPLHFSTQGTTYDLRGVEAASRLGFSRVVLARELSLKEIQQICAGTETEIEVFVHGALCVCYSGQCQLSRYFGGRSGNRGACAQPCRLPYETTGTGAVSAAAYPLSPRDLNLIDHLDELISAGVTSLKIEGRMKSPEYVATVVSIYRKYIDLYYRKGAYRVSPEDREALAQIFNRGGFTDAYLQGEDGASLMAGDVPKHRGIRIGRVTRRRKGSELADVALDGRLSLGDGVEIRGQVWDGRPACGNIVTYLQKNGEVWRIGDIAGDIRPGDEVWRISSKEQLTEAKRSFEGFSLSGEGTKPTAHRTAVNVRIIGRGDRAEVLLRHESGATVRVSTELHSGMEMDENRLAEALRKSGATPFRVERVEVRGRLQGGLKVSEMNALRRRGLEQMEAALRTRREPPVINCLSMDTRCPAQVTERYCFRWPEADFDESRADRTGEVIVVPVRDFLGRQGSLPEGQRIVPWVGNVTRGEESAWLETHFGEVAEACRKTGIYVGNLSWIAPFREAGVPVYGDYGLNVYNGQAEAALAALGVKHCVDSLEAVDYGEAGRVPLMTLQHDPAGEELKTKGRPGLKLVRRRGSDQTLLVPFAGTYDSEEDHLYRSGIRRVYGE